MGASANWYARAREIEGALPLRGAALVCEADETVRLRIAENLRAMGYKVHESASGILASFIITQTRLKVVLIGAVLPDMNGLELIRHARAWAHDALIVALSPRAEPCMPLVDELAHAAGADHALCPQSSYAALATAITAGRAGWAIPAAETRLGPAL